MTDAAAESTWREKIQVLLPLALVGVLLLTALVIGILQEEPDSDEYLYMNMSRAVLKGLWPYEDFFCSHLPAMLAPSTGLFTLFGASIPLARLIPAASTLLICVLTFLVGRRAWPASPFPAVFALTFLVTSVNFHLLSTVYIGLNLSVALALAGIYFHYREKPFVAGLFLGASCFVRLGMAPVLLLFLGLSPKRKRLVLGALIPAAATAAFLLVPNFLEQVFWYHLDKQAVPLGERFSRLLSFGWDEIALVIAAATGILLCRSHRPARPLLWALGVLFAFAVVQKVLWGYYLNPLLPFLALWAGAAVWTVASKKLGPHLLFIPNLVLLMGVGLLNIFTIAPRYRDDHSLRPVLEQVRGRVEPGTHFLDLTGGTLGAYVSMKTGLRQTGDHFDFNTQRIVTEGAKKAVGDVLALLKTGPAVVVTEIEPGARLNTWSRSRPLRNHLYKHYHLEEAVFQKNKGRILEIWTPAPEKRPALEPGRGEPRLEIFRVSVALASGSIRTYEERARWGMETDALAEFLNRHGPEKLVSDFIFADGATETLRPADFENDREVVTNRLLPRAQEEDSIRILAESFRNSAVFEPVSFVDAVFDRADGTLRRLTLFAEFWGRFYPIVRIQRVERDG
jgi:hypothetical protein